MGIYLTGYSNGEGAWGGGGGGASSYQSAPAVIGLDDVSVDAVTGAEVFFSNGSVGPA